MSILFISDLHLGPQLPQVTELALSFFSNQAKKAKTVYILGDFFEYWLGDDAIDPYYMPVINALKELSDRGTKIFFMHGNRDFLVGNRFCDLTGCTLLDDPSVIELGECKALLMHGDLLCSDDTTYQAFRREVRNPDWQKQFLSMSVEERIAFAEKARKASNEASKEKSSEIMDVNDTTVQAYFDRYGADLIIHGHTHRPAFHTIDKGTRTLQRIVLSDWSPDGHYLEYKGGKFKARRFSQA